MITDIRTIIYIFVLIGTFFIVRIFEKKKIKFSTRIIYATIIGFILGIIIQFSAGIPSEPSKVTWLQEISKWYGLFGYGFMDLLKMLVVPMVFASILRVIINMNEGENLKAITFRSLIMLLATTAIAAIVGIIIGNVMKLGVGVELGKVNGNELREIVPLVDTLRGLLPSNPVMSMANGNVVAVIIFASFLGIAVKRLNKKYKEEIKPFVNLVEAFYKIIVSVAMSVIKFMPYAVIPLLASTIIDNGLSSMISVVKFIVALYISVIIVFIIHLIMITMNGLNPITYIKNATEALLLAFTSRSSLGTLPVTIDTLVNNHGVEEGVSSFIASLGANMGMNGCAGIYPALMAITVANMVGIDKDISFYFMLLVVIAVSSLGIAGLPGTATMSVSVVLLGMGLGSYFPLVGGIIAIDPILDMGRTMLNVNGASVTAITVANSLGKVDKEKFSKVNLH
ncbi:sodium:dicarboxylate symporter [Romboutsia maritimum]|uniref:L-cystine uptake protein TcyP n=2 Tax=Romboutsia maritimum TaxID=2020948 RepID=A0A371ITN7_9FIRM|nr:sodium:dicarboxylate symporter [Romboutsia maritimum]